jgi:acylphosphatase
MSRVVRRIVVSGRVQGVGYRDFVAKEALRHNLEGWVRNRRDGSVEAILAGDAEIVSAVVEHCRKGPPLGRVNALTDELTGADALEQRHPGEAFSVLATL